MTSIAFKNQDLATSANILARKAELDELRERKLVNEKRQNFPSDISAPEATDLDSFLQSQKEQRCGLNSKVMKCKELLHSYQNNLFNPRNKRSQQQSYSFEDGDENLCEDFLSDSNYLNVACSSPYSSDMQHILQCNSINSCDTHSTTSSTRDENNASFSSDSLSFIVCNSNDEDSSSTDSKCDAIPLSEGHEMLLTYENFSDKISFSVKGSSSDAFALSDKEISHVDDFQSRLECNQVQDKERTNNEKKDDEQTIHLPTIQKDNNDTMAIFRKDNYKGKSIGNMIADEYRTEAETNLENKFSFGEMHLLLLNTIEEESESDSVNDLPEERPIAFNDAVTTDSKAETIQLESNDVIIETHDDCNKQLSYSSSSECSLKVSSSPRMNLINESLSQSDDTVKIDLKSISNTIAEYDTNQTEAIDTNCKSDTSVIHEEISEKSQPLDLLSMNGLPNQEEDGDRSFISENSQLVVQTDEPSHELDDLVTTMKDHDQEELNDYLPELALKRLATIFNEETDKTELSNSINLLAHDIVFGNSSSINLRNDSYNSNESKPRHRRNIHDDHHTESDQRKKKSPSEEKSSVKNQPKILIQSTPRNSISPWNKSRTSSKLTNTRTLMKKINTQQHVNKVNNKPVQTTSRINSRPLGRIKRDNLTTRPKSFESASCDSKWDPQKQSSFGGCQLCFSFLSEEERIQFSKKGHHHRVSLTRGGCSSFFCKICTNIGSDARLCRMCFHNSHRLKRVVPIKRH